MFTTIIQYPSGHEFDLDYYIKTHMPLAGKLWKPHGLVSAEVIKLSGDGPFQVYSILRWDSPASFQKAMTLEETKTIKDDVKNFTTAVSSHVIGETVVQA
ncbi:ethyl tert-butyl ether degradation ethd [Fusarium austroafricanum]|uniref:Ethyl tert-butyl ether degradation ethd n=1 Tax=Fusarium austroafricanum TaxID=2364996 RepID=A0A8H4NZ76_9HYPO|nr:ethyl tert-butyl ether degradation ethd [Fusarium austroafricanum]